MVGQRSSIRHEAKDIILAACELSYMKAPSRYLRGLAQAGPPQPALQTHLIGLLLYHVAHRPCPLQFAPAHSASSARRAFSRGPSLSNAEDKASQSTVFASPEPPQMTTPSHPEERIQGMHFYSFDNGHI